MTDQLLPEGTRIRFLKTLTSGADEYEHQIEDAKQLQAMIKAAGEE